jgi:hypothetical protein
MVNALLFASALYLTGWKLLFPVVLPSVGAYLTGIIFGVDTHFLLFLIPFIWLGNLVYVLGVKKFFVKEKNLVKGLLMPSAIKTMVIFLAAAAMVAFSVLPAAFLVAMGPMQLLTALSGGLLGLGIFKVRAQRAG